MKHIVIGTGIQPGAGRYFDCRLQVRLTAPRWLPAFELARRVRQHQRDAKINAGSNAWPQGIKRQQHRHPADRRLAGWPLQQRAGHFSNGLATSATGWRPAPQACERALALPRAAPSWPLPTARRRPTQG